jgi:hypothetical protein
MEAIQWSHLLRVKAHQTVMNSRVNGFHNEVRCILQEKMPFPPCISSDTLIPWNAIANDFYYAFRAKKTALLERAYRDMDLNHDQRQRLARALQRRVAMDSLPASLPKTT